MSSCESSLHFFIPELENKKTPELVSFSNFSAQVSLKQSIDLLGIKDRLALKSLGGKVMLEQGSELFSHPGADRNHESLFFPAEDL